MTPVSVRVVWAPNKTVRPSNGKYVTPAFFPRDPRWPNEAWSVVLTFDPPEEAANNLASAKAEFLVASAPHELLSPSATFVMMEGHRITALVVVD